MSDTQDGTELSVFNSADDTVANDNFLVQNLCDGDLQVTHSDMSDNVLGSMLMSSNASGDVHGQAYDPKGLRTYAEDLNGSGMLKTTNYDPKTEDVTGFSVYQPVGNNGSLTSFYDRDSVALGATFTQMNDNGFNSTVFDATGQAVSYEQDVFNADGSFSVANANISEDGSFYNSQLTNYASDSSIISSSSIDNNLYAAAVGGDITNIGPIGAMPQFSDVSNPMVCIAGGSTPLTPLGPDPISLGGARSAELAAAASAHQEDLRRSALEANAVQQIGASTGVVPDVNVFGHSSATHAHEATIASSFTGYSQSNDVSNHYPSPVVTSSVEVVPPISVGGSGYGGGSVEYGRQSTDASGYGTVQVDQDITNVRASDAAQRIAFDASPTSYHSVDQSVDSSVAYASGDSASYQTAQSLHSVQYSQSSSSSLMDQVSQSRSDSAFRAVEAHNMAAEVRSQIVPDSQQSVISNGGLSQHVQHSHQGEYYAAQAAPSMKTEYSSAPTAAPSYTEYTSAQAAPASQTEYYAGSTASSYVEPERATPVTRTSDVAERIAFDSAPTTYHPVDQSVEYNTSAVTHQHESSNLMDQVVAARKESAIQSNDSYKNELRKELIPSYTLGKDAPVQIFAAAKTRPNPPQPAPKPKVQNGSLNSLLEAKQNKRQVPPTQTKTEVLSHQTELAPPTQVNAAVEVPNFLGRMRDAVEPASTMQSTNQSLEQQVVNSSNHKQALGGSAFSSALGRANASRVSSEGSAQHLNDALINYHTISTLIQAGKVYEAQAVANCALESISQCSGAEPQLMPLVRAYVQLFEQRNMPAQASAFQAKEQSFCNQMATAGADLARNVWGA